MGFLVSLRVSPFKFHVTGGPSWSEVREVASVPIFMRSATRTREAAC